MEKESILTAASTPPVATTFSHKSFVGEISISTSRIDNGDDSGAGLFYVDIWISNLIPSAKGNQCTNKERCFKLQLQRFSPKAKFGLFSSKLGFWGPFHYGVFEINVNVDSSRSLKK